MLDSDGSQVISQDLIVYIIRDELGGLKVCLVQTVQHGVAQISKSRLSFELPTITAVLRYVVSTAFHQLIAQH